MYIQIQTKVSIQWLVLINFSANHTIQTISGFNKRILEPNILFTSAFPVKLIKVNTICRDCYTGTASLSNGYPKSY